MSNPSSQPDLQADTPLGALARNRAVYDALVSVTERAAARRDGEAVLRSAAIAAEFAYQSPIGRLTDRHLERLVVDATRGSQPAPIVVGDRRTGRVLHVLSHSSDIGGHSRLAWRWIARDGRISDLVLTNQSGPAAGELLKAAVASGGQVYDLRAAYSSLTQQARALRDLMDDVDVVISHAHPYDSVMLAAANLPGERPPIVFENHADHTFWLGLGAADLICDNRRIGQRVCAELRGVREDRLALLPLAIDPPAQSYQRSDLLAQFNAPTDSVLAICIATPGKLLPAFGTSFAQLADRILARIENLCLFVVGPAPEGEWLALAAQYPGRVRAVGLLPNADMLYGAADIYLDGYPVSTGTALLEAAEAGLPVLSLQETDTYSEVWTAESPGLTDPVHRTHNVGDYLDELAALAGSATLRRQRGAAARATVLAAHTGDGWRDALEELYHRAQHATVADLDEFESSEAPWANSYYQELLRFCRNGAPGFAFLQTGPPLPHSQLAEDPLYTEVLAAWLAAEAPRLDIAPAVRVRSQPGWQHARAWTLRALRLASQEPLISVSLPPVVEGDDDANTRLALDLLSQLGLTGENCGEVRIENDSALPLGVTFNLPAEPVGLDRVEAVARALRRDWIEPVSTLRPVPAEAEFSPA